MTEDLYAAIEHEIVPGVVQSLKIVTEAASRRFFRFALDWARRAGKSKMPVGKTFLAYWRMMFRQKVAIIGAKNSAAKAALDCYRHGAQVTMIVRSGVLSDKIKYWIKPDLENRIKDGSIQVLFNTTVQEIRESSVVVATADGTREIENDWVLATTGYQPDFGFLERLGLEFREDGFRTPVYDEATFETTRPGVYIAGTVCGGYQTSRWFIENGRFHARQIARHIARGRAERVQFEDIHWKTEE